eukprot:CAMPEP_0181224042 /NCGR_PEP_ID=MMETSP1096-20121128/30891_1 /TAXON_ID=156174 ORGANISM="Chrysochromulina ericina, Strain CCMP281" /NCGR_SAMPLE_ID=MMETSP1096 /ASSEMBLY_ACC=CAM_ASM_000453 /LENGTH=221 /DNA_ID=CAMNT_0023317049 /DNA_START=66 /DNA_END=728 /DNA_ORIENTATION=-
MTKVRQLEEELSDVRASLEAETARAHKLSGEMSRRSSEIEVLRANHEAAAAKHRAAEAKAVQAQTEAEERVRREKAILEEAAASAQQLRHSHIRAEKKTWDMQGELMRSELRSAEEELTILAKAFSEERQKRRETQKSAKKSMQAEQARWQKSAAEGWMAASRETKRRHATQLAVMSSQLSSSLQTLSQEGTCVPPKPLSLPADGYAHYYTPPPSPLRTEW